MDHCAYEILIAAGGNLIGKIAKIFNRKVECYVCIWIFSLDICSYLDIIDTEYSMNGLPFLPVKWTIKFHVVITV